MPKLFPYLFSAHYMSIFITDSATAFRKFFFIYDNLDIYRSTSSTDSGTARNLFNLFKYKVIFSRVHGVRTPALQETYSFIYDKGIFTKVATSSTDWGTAWHSFFMIKGYKSLNILEAPTTSSLPRYYLESRKAMLQILAGKQ